MAKYQVCPHCGERIILKDKPKVSRKKADFFDTQEQREISDLLLQNSVELEKRRKGGGQNR